MHKIFMGALGVVAISLVPTAASAQSDSYPVCTSRMQDHCQNPGEGGAPGRDRASDWKGGPPAHGSDGWHRRHHRHRHHD